jgi:DNA sulfur modification protein DndC
MWCLGGWGKMSVTVQRPTLSLFDDQRMSLDEAIELTVASLRHYGSLYKHWAISFSGGKDSSAVVTLVIHLIETGQIPKPESLTVIYADTRQELPPLHNAAIGILDEVERRGFIKKMVLPELDHRYFVYILGRGVPPPTNVFRWCTPKLKVMAMEKALEAVRQEHGEKLLMLNGVRIGESAVRDQRISVSCSKDGGECGQGWFQQTTVDAIADNLAPLLHWRVCHVWDWLLKADLELGFPTFEIAHVYGQDVSDGEEPLTARTGCIGCPLVQEDRALANLVGRKQAGKRKNPYAYLKPLTELRSLYWEVHKPQYRHRKVIEYNADGRLTKNQNRLGPLTIETRQWLLDKVLGIQAEVNRMAKAVGQAEVILINQEELARIYELIEQKTYPDKWDGTEPIGDVMLPKVYSDGSVQPLLFDESFM